MLQVSNQSNRPPAVDRLPLEQLAQVLQYVPLKGRLSSCALVHSSWRAAAAEATTEISLSQHRVNSISVSAWLNSHCSKVHVTKVSIHHSFRKLKGVFTREQLRTVPLRLPVIRLQYLQHLELDDALWESATVAGSGRQSKQSRKRQRTLSSLANLTALTSLVLSDRSVRLDGLETLTGLKHLSISYSPSSAIAELASDVPGFDTTQALLAAAVPKLPHLTRLSLTGEICSSTALAQISTMQHLEQLQLTETDITSLPAMPQSLTQLWMVCGGQAPEVFMGSSADHLSQLTGLQELTLSGEGDLDATILAGMIKLRTVYLKFERFAGADTQPLLVFSRLTALESIQLSCKARVTPAEAPALTTSSHLTCLRLDLGDTHDSLQEAHYEAMFPPGRQLLQLRQLRVGTALLSSQMDLGQLTGLETLALLHREVDSESDLDGGATFKLAAGLEKLTALKNLANLVLSAPSVDLPAGAPRELSSRSMMDLEESSLAALTGLRHLKVWCAPRGAPLGQHLLALTSCQRLEELHISAERDMSSVDSDDETACQWETSTPGFTGSMWLKVGTVKAR